MKGCANNMVIIFMNINENIRNERKMYKIKNGVPTNLLISHINLSQTSRLGTYSKSRQFFFILSSKKKKISCLKYSYILMKTLEFRENCKKTLGGVPTILLVFQLLNGLWY